MVTNCQSSSSSISLMSSPGQDKQTTHLQSKKNHDSLFGHGWGLSFCIIIINSENATVKILNSKLSTFLFFPSPFKIKICGSYPTKQVSSFPKRYLMVRKHPHSVFINFFSSKEIKRGPQQTLFLPSSAYTIQGRSQKVQVCSHNDYAIAAWAYPYPTNHHHQVCSHNDYAIAAWAYPYPTNHHHHHSHHHQFTTSRDI